ncbi:MAG: hypothetical protein IPG80_10490 [Anaerolineales bacterium]|uniref:hypothetical protein n=1 Tax=Candidatus Villigracilis vicinus TaxID=3140679 RepID=UPI00313612CA|nr:hypothetical protein [Anaerolineales bacterium]
MCASQWILIHGAEIEFRFLFRRGGVREKTKQAAKGERSTQVKKAIGLRNASVKAMSFGSVSVLVNGNSSSVP